ncbi:MAG: ABC transporter permease [Chthonomonadaceae bacterium]|nr:ABC transporter permease [Chthonomonadaceae bacterium]
MDILISILMVATPLLLAALGEAIVQKSGIVNVGLEGMMLTGAFAATLGALSTPGHPGNAVLGLLYALLAGGAMAALFAFFVVKLEANQVVVGVVVNLLALGLTGTIYRAKFGQGGGFISTQILPHLLGKLNGLTLFAFFATPLIWFWVNRTRGGLELRSCGEQPLSAEASGISVLKTRTGAILFGGMMAGLAGAYLSIGSTGTFSENMSSGRGFIALAIVTSGRWSAVGCLIAALVFGGAEALQFQGQALGIHLPYQVFNALPYVVTLLVLAFGGKSAQAPASLGRPYHKS